MTAEAPRHHCLTLCAFVTCALAPACKRPDPGPDFQIISESLRLRSSDAVPRTSPLFDGEALDLVAARGETVAFQVVNRTPAPVSLTLPGVETRTYEVRRVIAKHGSTAGLYGRGGRGAGDYPDVLVNRLSSAGVPRHSSAKERRWRPGW